MQIRPERPGHDRVRPDPRAASYVAEVVERVTAASLGQLHAAYLHGSAVLGGWLPGRSDIDLLLVVTDDLAGSVRTAVAGALVDAAGRCPGKALEASVVSTAQVRAAGPPWPFILHVHTPPGGEPAVVDGDGGPGDSDLLMHYTVCRAAAWAVAGPPPAELIAAVPRHLILAYLADEMDWGLANATEAYAVLNASRALIFLHDGVIVSKISGGETAASRGLGPRDVIERALRQQLGTAPDQPADDAAISFVRSVRAALRSAAVEADRAPVRDSGEPPG